MKRNPNGKLLNDNENYTKRPVRCSKSESSLTFLILEKFLALNLSKRRPQNE